MFSWTDNTGHVRDTEKLFSSDVTILSRATNLVFVVSFYNAWFACKLHFPVLNQTHLVAQSALRLPLENPTQPATLYSDFVRLVLKIRKEYDRAEWGNKIRDFILTKPYIRCSREADYKVGFPDLNSTY